MSESKRQAISENEKAKGKYDAKSPDAVLHQRVASCLGRELPELDKNQYTFLSHTLQILTRLVGMENTYGTRKLFTNPGAGGNCEYLGVTRTV